MWGAKKKQNSYYIFALYFEHILKSIQEYDHFGKREHGAMKSRKQKKSDGVKVYVFYWSRIIWEEFYAESSV